MWLLNIKVVFVCVPIIVQYMHHYCKSTLHKKFQVYVFKNVTCTYYMIVLHDCTYYMIVLHDCTYYMIVHTSLDGLRSTSPTPPPFLSPWFSTVTMHMSRVSQARSVLSSSSSILTHTHKGRQSTTIPAVRIMFLLWMSFHLWSSKTPTSIHTFKVNIGFFF